MTAFSKIAQAKFRAGQLPPEMDDELLYGDEYDDDYDEEISGSQGQGYYYADPNTGMIDGSGRSFDEEDMSDESGINKHMQQ